MEFLSHISTFKQIIFIFGIISALIECDIIKADTLWNIIKLIFEIIFLVIISLLGGEVNKPKRTIIIDGCPKCNNIHHSRH